MTDPRIPLQLSDIQSNSVPRHRGSGDEGELG